LRAYPESEIEQFARDPTFLTAAMKADPEATIFFFFCRTEPSLIWANIDLLEPVATTEPVLRLIAELAQTYKQQLLEVAWLRQALVSALNGRGSIETPLRIVHYLSGETDLASRRNLVAQLLHLLSSGECSVIERTLLFRSFLGLTHTSLVTYYAHFLQAAESLLEYAPNALRILGRQNLPAPTTRYGVRLLAIVDTFLGRSDADGHLAALEVLLKMSKYDGYAALLFDLRSRIHTIAIQTQHLEVFSGVLRVLHSLKIKPAFDVQAIGNQLIRQSQNDELVASVRRQMDESVRPRSRTSPVSDDVTE
jgi:hypothetical protein